MQRYTTENAMDELNFLGSILVQKVGNYLEDNDIINAARGLCAISKELYKIEEDSRRLRLTGELDVQIYTTLTKGYRQITDRIMSLAYEHHYAKEISSLHKSLRFTNEAPSLSDYLGEVDE